MSLKTETIICGICKKDFEIADVPYRQLSQMEKDLLNSRMCADCRQRNDDELDAKRY